MAGTRIVRTLFIILSIMIVSTVSLQSTAKAEDILDDLFGQLAGASGGGESGKLSVNFSRRYRPGEIIVSFADRRLYFIKKRGQAYSYPIAVPSDKAMWKGRLRVTAKKENPMWTPTQEMRREDPRLPAFVPGGDPKNPLGKRALYLGSTLYRIHGTDAPWTIGSAVSKGCIRMHNSDVIELYEMVPVGTRVTVTWKRFHS